MSGRGKEGKAKRAKRPRATEEEEEERPMSDKMTRQILDQAREQQQELETEEKEVASVSFQKPSRQRRKVDGPDLGEFDDDTTLEGEGLGGGDEESEIDEDEQDRYIEAEEVEEFTVEDEEALKAFMTGGLSARRTIADLIMEKLQEHNNKDKQAEHDGKVRIDPRIVECYTGVGKMLHSYRSGKLPKAFKIIPALQNWEEVLYYTEPDKWSPNAVRFATRLFASNLAPKMAQRYYNIILLPRIRDEINEKKKLHWSLYQALRKACYKPAAFYKGIILPLCEEGDCTLREATIVGSVIRHVSLPVLHSSVALLKLAEMNYTGANSIFMRIIVEKKYALPYRVVEGVVKHFYGFVDDSRRLPVLWHRCLLSFVQRYRADLSAKQIELLRTLLKAQSHDLITPEIRKNLFPQTSKANSTSRPRAAMKFKEANAIVME